jgi:hypothetical protein
MSPPTLVAAIAPGEAPQGLAGVEGPQAFDLEQTGGIDIHRHGRALALEHPEATHGQGVGGSEGAHLEMVTSSKDTRLPRARPSCWRRALGIVTWPLLVIELEACLSKPS